MLEGLIQAGFSINGTWPIRSELSSRMRGQNSNALASSIVLVCRPRPTNAKSASRREFLTALKKELPNALKLLQQGNIAPVDLAQASIGPGMAVFSRYAKVIESDGKPIRVRTALQLINQTLDEVLTEQEGEYDVDTRWAIAWFDQFGMTEGPYGQAETLATAKNTSVSGLVEAGFLEAKSGKVRLLRRDELDPNWNPRTDKRLTNWEIAQHLIHALDKKGETGAADILAKVSGGGEIARDLAYRLYTTCERKNWSQEALAYNSLVVSWPEISRLAAEPSRQSTVQGNFGF
jgi:putative DNA methylase